MREDRDKTRLVIKALVAVVVILAIVVLYLAVYQPSYNNLVAKNRVEGANLFISQVIIPELQSQGYVSIPVGNQTLYLVAVKPSANATTTQTSAPRIPVTGTASANTTK